MRRIFLYCNSPLLMTYDSPARGTSLSNSLPAIHLSNHLFMVRVLAQPSTNAWHIFELSIYPKFKCIQHTSTNCTVCSTTVHVHFLLLKADLWDFFMCDDSELYLDLHILAIVSLLLPIVCNILKRLSLLENYKNFGYHLHYHYHNTINHYITKLI